MMATTPEPSSLTASASASLTSRGCTSAAWTTSETSLGWSGGSTASRGGEEGFLASVEAVALPVPPAEPPWSWDEVPCVEAPGAVGGPSRFEEDVPVIDAPEEAGEPAGGLRTVVAPAVASGASRWGGEPPWVAAPGVAGDASRSPGAAPDAELLGTSRFGV